VRGGHLHALAALFNTRIPDTGCVYGHQERNPVKLISDFSNCFTLWKDKLGQISLAVTTLFWGGADPAVHRAGMGQPYPAPEL
jgi:hypothetical protein